jgi:hypothetical protein
MDISEELKALGFKNVSYLMNPGVYVLLYNGEVVYVGSTNNPLSRIGMHTYNIVYNQVYFVRCDSDELTKIEGLLIAKFRPRLNVDQNPTTPSFFGQTRVKIGGYALRIKRNDRWPEPESRSEYFNVKTRVTAESPSIRLKRRI